MVVWLHRAGMVVGVAFGLLLGVEGALTADAPEAAAASELIREQAHYPRVRVARERQAGRLAALFAAAGAACPTGVLLRAFKEEGQLELWAEPAAGQPYVKVATYPFLGYSGDVGPKRRRWDRQIPEGFYRVAGFNGASRYHLSIQIDYPNASDRILGNRRHPGNNIFIHGNEVTNGCIPIGDRAIEQVYLAVLDARAASGEVPVHIFPCRFSSAACRRLLDRAAARRPALRAFWTNLAEGYARFEDSRTVPEVAVDEVGRYRFPPQAGGNSARPR